MLVIRSALFNLVFALLTVVLSLLLIVSRPFGFPAAWFWGRGWSAAIQGALRLICGVRVEIEGQEHLPDTPCVVMAKHQSAFETIAMPRLIPPFVWVLKRELFYIPIFGWALWTLDAIAIRRSQPREALKQVLVQGKRFLEAGRWVVIFPEGTRSAPGESGQYQASGIMLAQQAHAGILPLAHFSPVTFSSATVDGSPIGTFSPAEIIMIDNAGRNKDSVSSLSGGTGFTATWLRSMSPVETCASPKSTCRRSACVPLPAPGGPRKINRISA